MRTREEFTGEIQKKGASRKGRIPTSILSDWANSIEYSGDKTIKDPETIRKLLASKGITKDKNVIIYCHSGVRSAHTTFVLTQVLGFENVSNYDGSWIEWSFNESLPIEEGEIIQPDVESDPTHSSNLWWWLMLVPVGLLLVLVRRRRSKTT